MATYTQAAAEQIARGRSTLQLVETIQLTNSASWTNMHPDMNLKGFAVYNRVLSQSEILQIIGFYKLKYSI